MWGTEPLRERDLGLGLEGFGCCSLQSVADWGLDNRNQQRAYMVRCIYTSLGCWILCGHLSFPIGEVGAKFTEAESKGCLPGARRREKCGLVV